MGLKLAHHFFMGRLSALDLLKLQGKTVKEIGQT